MPVKLTQEQAQVFDLLQQQRQVVIAGCAGSGKTTLAVEFARLQDQQGQKVLFLCRNPYLAEALRAQLKDSRVAVYAYTTFVRSLIDNAQQPDVFVPRAPARWSAPWTQFDLPSPGELNRAIDILYTSALRFDAVIIDEGQDFEAGWLEVVEACLGDGDTSCFVLFFDDNPRLTPLWPLRKYVHLHAPVALSRNCRSAGEIDSLVRQLHPGSPRAGLLSNDVGNVQEWNYSSENELLDRLRQALLAAEEFSPNLKDVVVISAESAPSRLSKFAGLVVDSPRLRASPSPGRLPWQAAVLRYLQGFGLLESELSNHPLPTSADIKRVYGFCAAYTSGHRAALYHQASFHTKHTLVWAMDAYGELRLRWEQASDRDLLPIDLLKFFSNHGWAASLPPAHKRYRLTPTEELSSHPDTIPAHLVDIPSFKGLEAGGVIFLLYNYFAENDDQFLASLYVAFSRARRWLYLITPFGSFDGTSQLSGH